MIGFLWLCTLIVGARLFEILLAKNHERLLMEEGAIEVGADHYKWIVMMHVAFFVFLIGEVLLRNLHSINVLALIAFLVLQVCRIWTIVSLGKYWNTKIIVLPGADLVKKGPYRWIKHPNYLIVALELVVFPLIFHAYFTAVIFTLLNSLAMAVRIPTENKALNTVSNELFEKD